MDTKPWYKQFWPWLLIVLPAACVVAALLTVKIAIEGADDMVVDNYYKDGKTINRVLDQDIRARELGLNAALSFNFASGKLNVSLEGEGDLPAHLQLQLLHPMEADRDLTVQLDSLAPGSYQGELDGKLKYSYLLRLTPVDNDQWRLNGEIDFRRATEATLTSQ